MFFFVGMYNPSVTASMPEMIDEIRRGDTSILRRRLDLYFDNSTALGMQMAVQCAEEFPFGSSDDLYTAAQGVQPQIASFFIPNMAALYEACRYWHPEAPDPRENLPVTSDIPTLLLSGSFDPITPPDWARQASASLSRAFVYEFPGNGHWVTRSSTCALQMALDFWQAPSIPPDPSCLNESSGLDFR